MFKRFGLTGLLILAAGIGGAIAQQWVNFPVIGGAAYCSSTVNTACVNTVPAGPALTGNETVPVDTNSANLPTTAKINVTAMGVGPNQYTAPLTGQSVVVAPNTRQLIIEPAGTIAAYAVVFPYTGVGGITLLEGQRLGICSTAIITTLTVTAGTGTTLNGAPTAALVPVTTGGASCPEWVYRASNTTWYRVH